MVARFRSCPPLAGAARSREAPPEVVAAERARVATEGWGARLLALRDEDGQWAGGAYFPAQRRRCRRGAVRAATHDADGGEDDAQPWTATTYSLLLLRDFGVDPQNDQVRETVALVSNHCRWEEGGQRYFDGEVEPCINGMTVALGAYFGQGVDGVVARLLDEQLEDGGWNCWAAYGSRRSSFATTINVLEGLLAHERSTGGSAETVAARRRGDEYLLERRLFRRKSTGEIVEPDWLQFSFPTRWHYDVLRALEYFRSSGDDPDPRIEAAIELLRSKQQPDGSWLLEHTHPGEVHFPLRMATASPADGTPSGPCGFFAGTGAPFEVACGLPAARAEPCRGRSPSLRAERRSRPQYPPASGAGGSCPGISPSSPSIRGRP